MSDFFGIGAALKGVARIYFRSAQQSGRTTTLLNSVKPGDRVCFRTHGEACEFMRKLKERNIEGVHCISMNPKCFALRSLTTKAPPEGRLIFDHVWLEDFYMEGLEKLNREVESLQNAFGGHGEKHEQTKLAAQEARKFWI